MKINKRL